VPETLKSSAGWSTRQSVLLELDMATAVINGAILPQGAINLLEYAPLLTSIPPAWVEELGNLMRSARGFHSTFEVLSLLADVVFETDYSQATLAMRALTRPVVVDRMSELAAILGLHPDPSLGEDDRLADLYLLMQVEQFERVGIQFNRDYQNTLRQGMLFTLRVIQGGDLHDRFWHWMDRFYYESYAPWRFTRRPWLEEQENQVVAFLGVKDRDGVAPELSWMSDKSPVLSHKSLKTAVENGELHLYLWVEPFRIPDAWVLLPGSVFSTFAQSGTTMEKFMGFTDELAGRLAALGDPTRLFILRMIRNYNMTNTDMAEYLKISRPTVSIHARILREAGLIRSHQDGRIVQHEIVPEEIHKLFKDLEQFLDLPEQ
jgi:DNA-binding transcriptional ArsR family regulator